MSTPNPLPVVTVTAAAAPWYTSPVQKAQVVAAVSALVALSPKLGKLIGVNTHTEAAAWVETIFGFITLVAPILGALWRARSQLQPLTLTQAKADAHPATIAVVTAQAAAATPVPLPGVPHVPNAASPLLAVPFAGQVPSGAVPPADSRPHTPVP